MTEPTSPSRRAGLRDEIAEALEAADYRMDMRRGDLADSVLPVLYRAWPWLRAEAEDAVPAGQAPATDQTAPVDWIDGHPQLEAIAAAVWEHCEHHDSGLIIDDPRNIAVAALAAGLPASVDRAAEATPVAASDAAANGSGTPVATSDPATLTDAERTMLTYALDQAQERIWSEDGFTDEDQAAVTSLRRLAVASAVVVRRATDETPGEAGRTVAYQSNGGSLLRCIAHAPEWAAILCGDFHPVTSDDLPDGGLCTMPDCGVDVLIPQQPKEARP